MATSLSSHLKIRVQEYLKCRLFHFAAIPKSLMDPHAKTQGMLTSQAHSRIQLSLAATHSISLTASWLPTQPLLVWPHAKNISLDQTALIAAHTWPQWMFLLLQALLGMTPILMPAYSPQHLLKMLTARHSLTVCHVPWTQIANMQTLHAKMQQRLRTFLGGLHH